MKASVNSPMIVIPSLFLYLQVPFLLLHLTGAETDVFPTCWRWYGECLDDNEPPLNIQKKIKPQENRNVVNIAKDIHSMGDCMKACESSPSCQYFTLYKKDLKKDCHLVGFNLGNSCNRLQNVCVLLKECQERNTSCGRACVTGRRPLHDWTQNWKTLVIGGTGVNRNKYINTIEALDENHNAVSGCEKEGTGSREAAAGGFIQDQVMVCGGYNKVDGYLKSCEQMKKGEDWNASPSPAIDMVTKRAFFSIAQTKNSLFAFGGYNSDDGMLKSIEQYSKSEDGTWSWATSTLELKSERSHTCAVTVRGETGDDIYVLGGWAGDLTYLMDVALLHVPHDGAPSIKDDFFPVPADRDGLQRGTWETFRRKFIQNMTTEHAEEEVDETVMEYYKEKNSSFWYELYKEAKYKNVWSDDHTQKDGEMREDFVISQFKEDESNPGGFMPWELVTGGRADAACQHVRRFGWRDGIILVGGYRLASSWLSSVWFLDLDAAAQNSQPWSKLADLSDEYDGGRHYLGVSTAKLRPAAIAGWSKGALKSNLVYNDCEDEDPLKPGIWTPTHQLDTAREKFVGVAVPEDFLKENWITGKCAVKG